MSFATRRRALINAVSSNVIDKGNYGSNATWVLTKDGTFTISGTGYGTYGDITSVPWADYKLLITNLIVEEGITGIGSFSFKGCTNLENVNLPNTITLISQQAFSGCSKLILSQLPSSLTEIGQEGFFYCKGITTLTFNSTLSSINKYAFLGCSNLRNIYVPWSEGTVANAPWGATNATIHYDTV